MPDPPSPVGSGGPIWRLIELIQAWAAEKRYGEMQIVWRAGCPVHVRKVEGESLGGSQTWCEHGKLFAEGCPSCGRPASGRGEAGR